MARDGCQWVGASELKYARHETRVDDQAPEQAIVPPTVRRRLRVDAEAARAAKERLESARNG